MSQAVEVLLLNPTEDILASLVLVGRTLWESEAVTGVS